MDITASTTLAMAASMFTIGDIFYTVIPLIAAGYAGFTIIKWCLRWVLGIIKGSYT